MPINSPKIIGLCGYPGSGKDAAAECLMARGWQRIAFADPVRVMAMAIDPLVPINGSVDHWRLSDEIECGGWSAAKKNPEVRRLLQRIGTEAVRNIIGPDTWVELAERSIPAGKRVIFTDVRFANEAAMIRRRGGLIVRIVRPGSELPAHNQHISEQYPFEPDGSILNDGSLEKLHNAMLELTGDVL